jgi:hypothetical protein
MHFRKRSFHKNVKRDRQDELAYEERMAEPSPEHRQRMLAIQTAMLFALGLGRLAGTRRGDAISLDECVRRACALADVNEVSLNTYERERIAHAYGRGASTDTLTDEDLNCDDLPVFLF